MLRRSKIGPSVRSGRYRGHKHTHTRTFVRYVEDISLAHPNTFLVGLIDEQLVFTAIPTVFKKQTSQEQEIKFKAMNFVSNKTVTKHESKD